MKSRLGTRKITCLCYDGNRGLHDFHLQSVLHIIFIIINIALHNVINSIVMKMFSRCITPNICGCNDNVHKHKKAEKIAYNLQNRLLEFAV